MRRAIFAVVVACSNTEAPPPKVADAPIHETAPIPTASQTTPAPATDPAPAPLPVKTAAAAPSSSSASATKKTGPVTAEECDKVNTHLAEVIAQGQGAILLQGFQNTGVFKGMREQCLKEVTREKYDCAMAATTMAQWQECMK